MEPRLWCSNRGTLLVPEPRCRWVRGIPHYAQKPWVLRQRTEPPASTGKGQSPQGRNGLCLGAEGGGRFRESHVTPVPKPGSRNGLTTQGVLPPYSGHSPDTGCEDPAEVRHPWHCPGRPRGLSISPPRGRHCQGETVVGRGEGAGKGWGCRGQPRRGILALPRPLSPGLRPALRTALRGPYAGPAWCRQWNYPWITRSFLRTPEQRALGAPFREVTYNPGLSPQGYSHLVTLGAPRSQGCRQKVRKSGNNTPGALSVFIKTLSAGSPEWIYNGPPSSPKLLKRPTVQTSSRGWRMQPGTLPN